MNAIIVHGGAGKFRPDDIAAAIEGCRAAASAGYQVLASNGHALDAVSAAVESLESDPVFNAGAGSHPNITGLVEMDAIIVDGSSGNFGAVAAIRNVLHPIRAARRVMEATSHCFLVGEGAIAFARSQGFEFAPDADLRGDHGSGPDHGTVGAVALDIHGNLAAATSTGGARNKMPGRVGDSPLIGCGALAENGVGAASATGHGESLMKIMMARTTLDFMREGRSAQEAADSAVQRLAEKTGERGGVICIDASGRVGFAFNTTHMARASLDSEGIAIAEV
ncbi:MAG: isoaspartyl peptidase/L-asparaginase [Candidatus Hydrogenedentota bacterium]